MRSATLRVLAVACGLAACGSPTAPSDTGLAGTVVRGPVQPVCQVDVPCDAPFSASFTVQQGSRVVASFRSDSQGHFESRLPPGMYLVVPGSDAPIHVAEHTGERRGSRPDRADHRPPPIRHRNPIGPAGCLTARAIAVLAPLRGS